jgi:L-arabinokinase
MGKRILEAGTGTRWGYASEIPPDLLRTCASGLVPTTIRGDEFLSSYGPLDDPLCRVEPTREYAVLDALRFPIEEHARCTEAISLLARESSRNSHSALERVGELMLQSHRGYSSIGLGHRQTDRMVDALRRLGPGAGIYGARVSGGGSGGTVVVLLRQEARTQLEEVSCEVFAEAAGPQPLIL